MLKPGDIKILNISRGARINADQSTTRFYNVTFSVLGQITDGIEVPDAEYTPEYVQRMVMEKASKHAEVLGFTG